MSDKKRLTDGEVMHLLCSFEHDVQMGHEIPLVTPVSLRDAFTELVERRATDLSDQEQDALRWLRSDAALEGCSHDNCHSCRRHKLAIATIDKLLGGK